MFSGLIRYVGTVSKPLPGMNEGEITIENTELPKLVEIGGSVAVNGACLTLTKKTNNSLTFFVSKETVERSTLGKLNQGRIVNLELPITPSSLLDGHIVLGHVDTVGKLISKNTTEGKNSSIRITIQIKKEFMKYIVPKGSIAVDGISLTIADYNDSEHTFSVQVIPYTFENTNLKYLNLYDEVNIEFDIIGKYVERLLEASKKILTMDKLRDFLGT
jgi:riboflavin synthase